MLTTFSKFFSTVLLGISALFGGHVSSQIQPVTPNHQEATTTLFATSPTVIKTVSPNTSFIKTKNNVVTEPVTSATPSAPQTVTNSISVVAVASPSSAIVEDTGQTQATIKKFQNQLDYYLGMDSQAEGKLKLVYCPNSAAPTDINLAAQWASDMQTCEAAQQIEQATLAADKAVETPIRAQILDLQQGNGKTESIPSDSDYQGSIQGVNSSTASCSSDIAQVQTQLQKEIVSSGGIVDDNSFVSEVVSKMKILYPMCKVLIVHTGV